MIGKRCPVKMMKSLNADEQESFAETFDSPEEVCKRYHSLGYWKGFRVGMLMGILAGLVMWLLR